MGKKGGMGHKMRGKMIVRNGIKREKGEKVKRIGYKRWEEEITGGQIEKREWEQKMGIRRGTSATVILLYLKAAVFLYYLK